MNHEQAILHGTGQAGRDIWNRIKAGDVGHNELLKEMRATQEALALYSKFNKMDEVQKQMVGEIKLLETFAWRTYMFGKPNQFAIRPGLGGEFAKRLRMDTAYHKKRDFDAIRFGEAGCQMESNIFTRIKRPCLRPGCRHKSMHAGHKWLKMKIRADWESSILNKWRY